MEDHLFPFDLIQSTNDQRILRYQTHQDLCISIASLIKKYPEVSNFFYKYFKEWPQLFDSLDEGTSQRNKKRKTDHPIPPIKLVLAALRLLFQDFPFFSSLWNWAPVLDMLKHSDEELRWLSFRLISVVAGLPPLDIAQPSLVSTQLPLLLKYERLFPSTIPCCERRLKLSKPLKDIQVNHSIIGDGKVLSKVLLPISNSKEKPLQPFYQDSISIQKTMQNMALGITAGQPLLLQGPIGSGKTTLIAQLANKTGRGSELIKVQLGDQMDSKMLIGGYCCTNIPGEFVWRPGPLTQAMEKGLWLVLEDVDLAPMDVVSLLVPVLQSNTLVLPGRSQPLRAAPGFHLLATKRLVAGETRFYSESSTHADMLCKLWKKISVMPLSREDLSAMITTRWPHLEPLVSNILELYFIFSQGGHDGEYDRNHQHMASYGQHRTPSTRDLVKLCQRIALYYNSNNTNHRAMMKNIFMDTFDIFASSVQQPDIQLHRAQSFGELLGFNKGEITSHLETYSPESSPSQNQLTIGRVTLAVLPLIKEKRKKKRNKVPFALTRQALCTLESISMAIANNEPVLLVGETGIGKTSLVQYLAESTRHKLTVINMNQQSDSIDLLGGFKPVELKTILKPFVEDIVTLFPLSLSVTNNGPLLDAIQTSLNSRRYAKFLKLCMKAVVINTEALYAKRETTIGSDAVLKAWNKLKDKILALQRQLKKGITHMSFYFIKGALVEAMINGDWILLDEINLAEAETLECLNEVLEDPSGSILLHEKGDQQPIKRHKDFRLLACMNPATDVGKKELPKGIRSRFTELYINELENEHDLIILTKTYVDHLKLQPVTIKGMVDFYKEVREASLTDGVGGRPHYSLRTLCRALCYVAVNHCNSLTRSLFEGFCLSFLTQLNQESYAIVKKLIFKHIIRTKSHCDLLKQPIKCPTHNGYIVCAGFWIHKGSEQPPAEADLQKYILTTTVKQNLADLARIVSYGKHPVLIQGDTSVGKTSLITYLANYTGNRCLRVNNHEHTDLQEYVGSYTPDPITGRLIFTDGVLVKAMKEGSWIILDELNLAPTEVLEALNRVLDDNRELFIPETHQTIQAHPNFMLFATQNPPGLYGGRKLLSRAFRNRFIELHFNEIPAPELEEILTKRCGLPESYSKKMVRVMRELQIQRRTSGIFAGKRSFITLRDLFRWGERYKHAPENGSYSWQQHMADEGYLLLAGRVRKPEEEQIVRDVLQEVLKERVDPDKLFSPGECPTTATILSTLMEEPASHLVWTRNLRRMAVLAGKSLSYKEPVLLVGDTGCGKTTICQLIGQLSKRKLYYINCHMHSESADFLGGLRPVRNHTEENAQKLFEWVDGPLVKAMRDGSVFLADEISLADDSVLERINSVLEPEQTLLLAEKQNGPEEESTEIKATKGFHFMATMNPGGDYGKKELSPALRNRFTEIWCPSTLEKQDVVAIVNHNIKMPAEDRPFCFGTAMVNFLSHFALTDIGRRCTLSVRDILSWVHFINHCVENQVLSPAKAFLHGASLVFLDSIGSGNTGFASTYEVQQFTFACLSFLLDQIGGNRQDLDNFPWESEVRINTTETTFGIGPFHIKKGLIKASDNDYALHASTPCLNALRILRAMQLCKPVLLEGVPGVGKTSLITTLAKLAGHQVTRINLSEQTDISDLFGADLPVDGGSGGQFAWRDGPLLQALKAGHWILLDELNLASQSVLEGLNACLDHRGEVYVPELGMTFCIHNTQSKVFGCQNPHYQGGARKGLPRSFLNRFTQVYIQALTSFDLRFIASSMHPEISKSTISDMVTFNEKLVQEVQVERKWGMKGGPWELNLRDIFRWCELMKEGGNTEDPCIFVELIYGARMRTKEDKLMVLDLVPEAFCNRIGRMDTHPLVVTPEFIQVGSSILPRVQGGALLPGPQVFSLHCQLKPMEHLMKTLSMNWMAILVGSSASGKTSLVRTLAALTGNPLTVFTLNTEMDATELLGGFEQVDFARSLDEITWQVELLVSTTLGHYLHKEDPTPCQPLLVLWNNFQNMKGSVLEKINLLSQIVSHLGTLEGAQQQTLEESLKELQKDVLAAESDSSGGCFQWVDSLLVRAMKQGHWLLLDDANFCSPAVLDRLNGLLEPNGRLELSERGVVGGSIPSIHPHPSFRLILAMDPKNGEISRAMRNRGVEIYLLGEEEEVSSHDKCLLLRSMGLEVSHLASALLNIHSQLTSISTGSEKPSLLDLLGAALSVVQRVNRNQKDQRGALYQGCLEGYIHNALSFSTKKEFEKIIKSGVENMGEELASFDQFCGEPSIQDLLWNHRLGARRQFSVMQKRTVGQKDKATRLLLLYLRIYLEQAPFADVELILSQFTQTMASTNLAELAKQIAGTQVLAKPQPMTETLIESLRKLASLVHIRGAEHLPMDLRWNMPLYLLIQSKASSIQPAETTRFLVEMNYSSNRYLMWLRVQCLIFRMKEAPMDPGSIISLSIKFSNKELTKEELPHHAVALVLPFTVAMNKFLENLFALQEKYEFPNEDYAQALGALDKYEQLYVVACEAYTHFKAHLSKFRLHWRNFLESSIVFSRLPNISSDLNLLIHKLNLALQLGSTDITLLRSKVARWVPCPLPFPTEDVSIALDKVIRTEKRLEHMTSVSLATKLNLWKSLANIRVSIYNRKEDDILQADPTSLLTDLGPEEEATEDDPILPIVALLNTFFQSSQELSSLYHATNVELLDGPLYLVPSHSALLQTPHIKGHYLSYFGVFLTHLFKGFDLLPWQAPDDQQKWSDIKVAWTRFSPVLSHAISQFSQSSSISLGGYETWAAQLGKITSLLWLNMDNSQFSLISPLSTAVNRLVNWTRKGLEECSPLPDHIQTLVLKLDQSLARPQGSPRDQQVKLAEILGRLGYLLFYLLQPLDLADPVLQTEYAIAHLTHQEMTLIEELEIYKEDHYSRTGQQLPLDSCHPSFTVLQSKLLTVRKSLRKLMKRRAYRPPGTKFEDLKERIGYFVATICSERNFENHFSSLLSCLDPATRPAKKEVERILKEAANWKENNILSFTSDLESNFFQYPDLTGPCVASIRMIHASIELLYILAVGPHLANDGLPDKCTFIGNLGSFPSKLGNPGKKAVFLQANGGKSLSLQVAALQELNNQLALRGTLDSEALACHTAVLEDLSENWLMLQAAQKAKEEEENCLYEQQVANLSVEEREKKELEDFFAPPKEHVKTEMPLEMRIWRLHQEFVGLTSSSTINLASVDILHPYKASYDYCLKEIAGLGPLLDGAELEEPLYCGHLVASQLPLALPQAPQGDNVNFYKDPNPTQVISCLPLLRKILLSVQKILEQYPEQPILMEIQTITHRVLTFPLTAPLSKFVSGLELVLTEAQHWLQYAHRGIALKEEMQQLTQQILKWRRLELKCWSKSLDDVLAKIKTDAAKWWFNLYTAIVKTPFQEEEELPGELTATLVEFMEVATLGDFGPRLKLLETFVHHVERCCPKSHKNQRRVHHIVYNVHHYFSQFLPAILAKIKTDRQPLEKEIKDYIKILRWNDTSFFAVKECTQKSHSIVHKAVKKFEAALLQPIRPLLECQKSPADKSSGAWDFTLELETFLQDSKEEEMSAKSASYLKKMKHFCQQLVTETSYVNSVKMMNSFIGDIIEEMNKLQSLEVDRSKPEEAQKKQAGFISQRKRKSLAELFKVLRELGLSFHKGEIQQYDARQFLEESVLCIPPSLLENKSLVNASEEHQHYFYSCMARLEALKAALQKPSKELVQSDIQRAKGFSYNLAHIILDQRKGLQTSMEELETLREKIYDMERLVSTEPKLMKGSVYNTSKDHLAEFLTTVASLVHLLLQTKIILECSPSKLGSSSHISPRISMLSKSDPAWQNLIANLTTHLTTLTELHNSWEPGKTTGYALLTWMDLTKLQQDFDRLCLVAQDLTAIANAMLSTSCHLKTTLLQECSRAIACATKFRAAANQVSAEMMNQQSSDLLSQLDTLQDKVCLAIQSIYKQEKDVKGFTENLEDPEKEDSSLIKKLHQHSYFSKHFHLSSLLGEIEVMFQKLMNADLPLQIDGLASLLPFLHQLEQVYLFYTVVQLASYRTHCKFLHILLGVFTELVQKGFCIPPGLLPDEPEEQGTEFKDFEDAGIGEGQGRDNVNDRIEDEGQVDGLQNEEKQDNEDEHIPEEENGLEMSNDFEGKTFDPDQKEEDEGNNEEEPEEEAEAKDEMGETGDGEGETLDKEMWGSDNEEEEQEPQTEDKSGKAGETMEENTMQPQDENAAQQKEESQKEKKETEEDINSIDGDEEDNDGQLNEQPYDESNLIPPQEPKDLEIPDEMDEGDDGQESGQEDIEETNPHDIDEMKNAAEQESECPEAEQEENEENPVEEMDVEDENMPAPGGEELPDDEEEGGDEASCHQKEKENPNTEPSNMPATDAGSRVQDQPDEEQIDWTSQDNTKENNQEDGQGKTQASVGDQDSQGESNNPNTLADPSTPKPPPKYSQPSADRTVSENPQPKLKKASHVMEARNQSYDTPSQPHEQEAEAYEHVRDKEEADAEMLDFATEEQAQKAPMDSERQEDAQENDDIIPEEDKKFEEPSDIQKLQSDRRSGEKQKKDGQKDTGAENGEDVEMEEETLPPLSLEEEKELKESYFVTHHQLLESVTLPSKEDVLEYILSSTGLPPSTSEGLQMWRRMEDRLTPLVQELCEQLRMVLEPSKCSKLQGDYRTGKRLNMRKVIPYLASHFRKDKIWLRRTKPHQRQYQIILAVDNSKSMTEFHAGTMALEALTMVSKALQLLEAGKMAVLSFGEVVRPLISFQDILTPEIGASIMEAFTFSEAHTRIVDLLNYAEQEIFMKEVDPVGSVDMARLLIIFSDGINYTDGDERVKSAVRRAKEAGIFVVFIAMANPKAKVSLVDIQHHYLLNGKVHSERRLEKFPFPYYVILQNLENTPMVLGEALRQWFELVSSTKH